MYSSRGPAEITTAGLVLTGNNSAEAHVTLVEPGKPPNNTSLPCCLFGESLKQSNTCEVFLQESLCYNTTDA